MSVELHSLQEIGTPSVPTALVGLPSEESAQTGSGPKEAMGTQLHGARVLPKKSLLRQPVFWFYGSASVAFGIKDNAFSYLLLMYCNQVLQMPGYLAARAMAIALAWDAVWDVFIGHLSDKTSSRLGRRHPFMYLSLFILPPSFFALFNPIRELSSRSSFTYVVVLAVIVRTGTTLFEVPSIAQLPDLEKDYELRNKWLTLRYTFGWLGGASFHMVNFACWVGVYGNASQTGYSIYARAGAVIIFVTILTSSLGTQRLSSAMPRPSKAFKISEINQEVRQALHSIDNPNFQALFFAGIAGGVASGLDNALTMYIFSYFFEFTGPQIAVNTAIILVSPIIANGIAPRLGLLLGKKRAALASTFVNTVLTPVPMILVLVGCWPAMGSWRSLYVYAMFCIVFVLMLIISGVMSDSMMADVVEDGEVNTDRRAEGLYFAARGFAGKVISGCGVMFAGNIISIVGLDTVSSRADMTRQKKLNLVMFYVPLMTVLRLLSMHLLSRYTIGRAEHEFNLSKLAERRSNAAAFKSEEEDVKLLPKSMDTNGKHGEDLELSTRRRIGVGRDDDGDDSNLISDGCTVSLQQ